MFCNLSFLPEDKSIQHNLSKTKARLGTCVGDITGPTWFEAFASDLLLVYTFCVMGTLSISFVLSPLLKRVNTYAFRNLFTVECVNITF